MKINFPVSYFLVVFLCLAAMELGADSVSSSTWTSGGYQTSLISGNGKPGRITLALISDGYTAGEKDKFLRDAKRIADGLFTSNGFKGMEDLFNIYAAFTAAKQSTLNRSSGETQFTADIISGDPKDEKKLIAYIRKNFPAMQAVMAIANSKEDGVGVCTSDFKFAIVPSDADFSLSIAIHEAGHLFGELVDEYAGSDEEGPNVTRNKMNPPWKGLSNKTPIEIAVDDDDPRGSGYFRPSSENCVMLDNEETINFCAVCKDVLRKAIAALENGKVPLDTSPLPQ